MKDFSLLERRLGVTFSNQDLLRQALVHRSYLNENPGFNLPHNERLEFLGDAVLELVVTEHLYNNFPNPEGELTNWRAALVNAIMLSGIAADLGLEDYLYLSRGEAKDAGTKARQFILANAIEAVIGAIYLDQGTPVAAEFIKREVLVKLPEVLANKTYLDPKSRFQELAQDKVGVTPHYLVLDEQGPDHAKQFRVGLYLGEELVAEGTGSSKQEAQVAAAEAGLNQKSDWQ
ncbi:MAG: Ribonuclease 3 [Parcubacteria group bacterium GW2011_GWD2_43_10]|uniref:Ribonuclease 3 n=4 Tax=Candidatus Vebleniibacteriota TaxID=1817921 RepID=A0A1G2Q7A3_9BACT|nr:MAG: Ribonuclease 3 [Parcubacteria group bacterium GW2011_GWA2_42_80]KKS77440.1 MAG: Ribonuclease 3 [Parcubacteria group bacterium GW2011_GWD1_42_9]KKS81701.1 MAG: Ribonuclease 3 [Parcubacteria group bacterium GW2011_GWD2_43_10]KKS93836.1 MAG: Ribonuclease 3 [Parcubacteria group bacterium GW2011_GWE2_43_12]KKT12432.1 MAG: Ribonuclease 3 [Parcubacteria group bacterium GW2011_GWA1_43_27]KKT14372.1 MAG: Ribonuclease 3 [Parcubacteria group bacterium GW2011_GWF2_43_38]KKT16568.1 MAG: Ribonuclea